MLGGDLDMLFFNHLFFKIVMIDKIDDTESQVQYDPVEYCNCASASSGGILSSLWEQ